ncbi:MAG: hypothetical protein FIA99_09235 [Ruminiclostridium sp.]|nr:hypothetical protein [Ruminiclostridium sp.]
MNTASTISSQKTIQQIINETSNPANGRDTGELGKDDFLNLLVTQLRYQDPLNPTDDKEFIGQMAQFSALEQMQNMNGSFAATKAFSLIGKNVTANKTDSTTKETSEISGEVTNVKLSGGKTYVVVNGEDIPVESVTKVSEGLRSSQSNIAAFTGLIGFNVSALAYNPENGDMIMVGGIVKAIQKGSYEDYAVIDGVEVEIAELVTDTYSTDPDFMREKLQEASDEGKEISFYIVDRSTGKKIPVTATIKEGSLDFSGRNIHAVINGLRVPVEGITNITKPLEQIKTEIQQDTVPVAELAGV